MRILPHNLAITKDLLTSRSGLVCIATMLQNLNFCRAVDGVFPAPQSNRGYKPSVFVTSLLLMLLEGGRCLDDLRHIRDDKALRTLLGLAKVPESDSVGDWLRRMGQQGVTALTEINRLILKTTLHTLKTVTLDIDATLCASGKKSAQWTYKKCTGYMPMVGHIAETGQVVATEFREGNTAPAAQNLEFIQACQDALPQGVRVGAVRIDAAGYQAAIIDMCCARGIKFAIRAKHCKSLKDAIQAQSEDQWQPLLDRQGRPIEGASTLRTVHTMDKSQNPFTLIVQRQAIKGQLDLDLDLDLTDDQETVQRGGYLYRALAVSHDDSWTDSQWVNWYNQRGDHAENRIKELKADFAAGRLPCQNFEANALYFSLCALAYNVFVLFRAFLPARFESARASTIRWRLFGLAGKVVHHGRTWSLKVAQASCELLQDVLRRLALFRWETFCLET